MKTGTILVAVTLVAAAVLAAGCGGGSSKADQRQALDDYVARVEAIRLPVNELLDQADPILSAYNEHRISPAQAHRRFGALERRFAGYAVQIAAVDEVPSSVRTAQEAYAHTFILEDSYLSALDAALAERDFEHLPDTQNDQRAAIIGWRTRLEVVADQIGAKLPADLRVAGRGEIAPSPIGS
jgi:hypothetical protein